MTPAEEIEKMWEKYEENYPLLADHYRPPTIYVRGKSLDDKIEITHIRNEQGCTIGVAVEYANERV